MWPCVYLGIKFQILTFLQQSTAEPWRVIPGWSKWLITMVSVRHHGDRYCPLRIGLWDPFRMAMKIAYNWVWSWPLTSPGMILQIPQIHISWESPRRGSKLTAPHRVYLLFFSCGWHFEKKNLWFLGKSHRQALQPCALVWMAPETLRVFGRVKILSWKKNLWWWAPDQGGDTLRSLSME